MPSRQAARSGTNMADNSSELRSIAWSQAFPFVRLFQTLRLALSPGRLALALAAVVLMYVGGRVLDRLWGTSHGVVQRLHNGRVQTEIEAYVRGSHTEFRQWVKEARAEQEQRGFQALRDAKIADTVDKTRELLAAHPLRELTMDTKQQQELVELRTVVEQLEHKGLDAIAADGNLSDDARTEKRRAVVDAADGLRRMLHSARGRGLPEAAAGQRAIETLVTADPNADRSEMGTAQSRLLLATVRVAQVGQYERLQPRGPFIALIMYESNCFAAAIQGVCSGRWGFQAGASDPQPALAGSIESAVRGGLWLLNQHPCYSGMFGLYLLLVFAYFGGAICRSAAVQSARDEVIPLKDALAFVRARYGSFLAAPLLPLGVFVGIGVLLALGGLFGAVGYIGELGTGLFYGLALFGGFALALIALAAGLGFHLMWPTVAVEGSDGFDALSRACSYVSSRIWHVLFYTGVLLLYGGIAFVIGRLVLILMLKFAHKFTGLGMNLISSAELTAGGKLNAMWSLPAWADLSLLPSTSDTPFWGTFVNGPLDATERVGALLIAVWVHILVTLLGAFVVSYFFCGSTQMYFLLRRDVDATDFEEVYYEEPAEEPAPAAADAPPTATEPPPASV
jgi:hypothetical protein